MEFDSSSQAGTEPEPAAEQPPLDAQTLVDRMVAAGEWPEPALLEKIIDAGDSAVAPLISVLRTYPRGWPQEAPLEHAMCLLSILRPPAAIPELIEIIRRYGEESGESAAQFLGSFGAIAFELLLDVCRDPGVTGYPRTHAMRAAIGAAGDDPSLRARLADVIRPMLADAIERLRHAQKAAEAAGLNEFDDETPEDESEADLADFDDETPEDESEADLADISEIDDEPDDDHSEDDSQNFQGEYSERAPDLYDEIFFLVNDLAALADPGARDLIQTAFDEDMVETFLIDEASVERQYQRGGEPVRKLPNWLDKYREEYRKKHSDRPCPSPKPLPVRALRPEHRSEQTASPPPLTSNTPLRNVGPVLGRNEPCWCGSGKKYKKCHLGKDTRN